MKEEEINNKFILKWETQVRKGILEFIILSYLNEKENYGYELITKIMDFIDIKISEGTIYPLLNRLKREELITSKWVEMDAGVPRKYYFITDLGKDALLKMKNSWAQLNYSLQKLMV